MLVEDTIEHTPGCELSHPKLNFGKCTCGMEQQAIRTYSMLKDNCDRLAKENAEIRAKTAQEIFADIEMYADNETLSEPCYFLDQKALNDLKSRYVQPDGR
jgi:hypothetical protein